jgi:hypothetical protein
LPQPPAQCPVWSRSPARSVTTPAYRGSAQRIFDRCSGSREGRRFGRPRRSQTQRHRAAGPAGDVEARVPRIACVLDQRSSRHSAFRHAPYQRASPFILLISVLIPASDPPALFHVPFVGPANGRSQIRAIYFLPPEARKTRLFRLQPATAIRILPASVLQNKTAMRNSSDKLTYGVPNTASLLNSRARTPGFRQCSLLRTSSSSKNRKSANEPSNCMKIIRMTGFAPLARTQLTPASPDLYLTPASH